MNIQLVLSLGAMIYPIVRLAFSSLGVPRYYGWGSTTLKDS